MEEKCPYCGTQIYTPIGMRIHLGKKHMKKHAR